MSIFNSKHEEIQTPMLKLILLSCSLLCLTTTASAKAPLQDYQFIGPEKQVVKAQIGSFHVPENRELKNSRNITLKFVRFPTSNPNPANPIVYLAGGPGGSATGTAKRQRFPLFMKLREVADVILFDQRGTGLSNDLPTCKTAALDVSRPTIESEFLQSTIDQIKACVKQWQSEEFDLAGYNTLESAKDLVALKTALGTDKINLWGISYGTHLAFAASKYHPEIIDKMVLASSEGLDHTVKRPARVQALLKSIDNRLKQDSKTATKYPDLLGTMRRVFEKLESNPKIVQTQDFRSKQPITVGLAKMDIQFLVSYLFLRDPEHLVKMPRMFYDMDKGEFREVATYLAYLKSFISGQNPMALAMDTASGISNKRWQQVQREAETSLVGRTTNLPHPDVNQYVPVKDLGGEFRKEVNSAIPTLFFAGTLDGRTLYQSQLELAQNFSNGTFITVDGAGHNLFMSHPDITTHIVNFLSGKKVAQQTIKLNELIFE